MRLLTQALATCTIVPTYFAYDLMAFYKHRYTISGLAQIVSEPSANVADRRLEFRRYNNNVNSAFHPSGVGKLSPSLLAGIKARHVHLCRVAGNTV